MTSLGIHFNYDAVNDTFAIVGVAAALKHQALEGVTQWLSQHAMYKTLVVPSEALGEMRAILRDIRTALAQQPTITDAGIGLHNMKGK